MAAKRAMQAINHATGIKHPDVTRHHVMHHVFDAVCVKGFIQSKKTAEMAYSNHEMEHSPES